MAALLFEVSQVGVLRHCQLCASCAPAVLETPLADLPAQVSLVLILPRACLAQGLHRGTTETC